MNGSFLRTLLWIGVVAFFLVPLGTAAHWIVNRVYVPEGYSLRLRYKGPILFGSRVSAPPGQYADYEDKGEIGVLEEMKGPGRHFYCPIWWERVLVEDLVVDTGEIAVVTSKVGVDLPPGQILVEGDVGRAKYRGTLRHVLGPGRYRLNSYGYEYRKLKLERTQSGQDAKVSGWVEVPTGYVGVVTNLIDNPAEQTAQGVQAKVLQPGLYLLNPREKVVDIIEVGYREKSISVEKKVGRDGLVIYDESGEPQVADYDSGISFPSSDGFKIAMDFTCVWGILPEHAPHIVMSLGSVAAVEEKVVVPQIESICRNTGSTKGAVELLVGDTRQKFQEDTTRALDTIMDEKQLSLLYGLVRHIYIPTEVRLPIQKANVADELKLTRDQEQLTAKAEANLREAERKVELEKERIIVETEKLVAKVLAEGQKKAEETKAETIRLVAEIDKQVAALEAQAVVLAGRAKADVEKLIAEAKSDKFRLAVEAFGTGDAYNLWVFATNLPEDIQLRLLYAGEGTFWTDLKGFTETLLGKQMQAETPAVNPRATPPRPTR